MTQATTTEQNSAQAKPEAKPANGQAIQLRPVDLLKKSFEQWRPTLKAILPKHIDPDRVIKIAMSVYLNKPELQACTPLSMVRATLQAAELGLDPSSLLGEAYFLPFNNKKKKRDGNTWKEEVVLEVQLMPGYVGLVKLAKQTGDVADVYAVVVDECEKEETYFMVERGTINRIHHKVRMDVERTGKLFAVYGVVKFKDGTHHFEVMSKSDVEAIRSRSKSKDSGPWVTDYFAMARKTAIKQALKTIPKSPEKPQLAQAIAADTAAEIGEAFNTDLVIDTDGVDVTEQAQAAAAATPTQEPSRTQKLSDALDEKPAVKHDKDGVVQ